jgi:hypothetical protein
MKRLLTFSPTESLNQHLKDKAPEALPANNHIQNRRRRGGEEKNVNN